MYERTNQQKNKAISQIQVGAILNASPERVCSQRVLFSCIQLPQFQSTYSKNKIEEIPWCFNIKRKYFANLEWEADLTAVFVQACKKIKICGVFPRITIKILSYKAKRQVNFIFYEER